MLWNINLKYKEMEYCDRDSTAKPEIPSQIHTPEEGEFQIQTNYLKNILQMYVRGAQEDGSIERNQQFLTELFQIVEKHRKLDSDSLEIQKPQEITQQMCQEIHQIAVKHGAAKRFSVFSQLQPESIPKDKLCKCGCKKAAGDPLPFCSNEVKEYFFGPAIILTFFFVRKMSLLLIISCLIYAVYSLATNILSAPQITDQCDVDPGTLTFFCAYKYLSTVRYKASNSTFMTFQVWLGLLFCLVWILGMRIIRNMGRNLNRKVDQFLDSSSDYVIQMSNLPEGTYTEKQIVKYVANLWRKYKGKRVEPATIKSVQIIYKMDQVDAMIAKIVQSALRVAACLEKCERGSEGEQDKVIEESEGERETKRRISEKLRSNTVAETLPIKYEFKIKMTKTDIYNLEKEQFMRLLNDIDTFRQNFITNCEFRKKMTTGMAFIQFADSEQQTEFLRQIRQYRMTILGEIKEHIMEKVFPSEDSLLFKGQNIRITRAPEPSDIHWKNCEKQFSYRRVFLVWFLTLVIVCISFAVLVFIAYLRKTFPVFDSLSILISISLQIFNRIIWNALVSFVGLEENNTKTDDIISVMTKSAFASAINVIVLPILMKIVLSDSLYGPEGLVGIVLDFQFIVFFMMVNLNVINFPFQIKRLALCIPPIRNYLIRSKISIVGELDTREDIKDVLSYYEPPPFPVASAYVYMITIIYQAVFFCHLQPTLLFYVLFNLGVFYLVLKYLLIRRCSVPELFDFIIFQTTFSILQYVPLFYGIGSLVFVQIIGEGNQQAYEGFHPLSIASVLCILLWLLDMINPKGVMNIITHFLMELIPSEQENEAKLEQTLSNEAIMKRVLRDSVNSANVNKISKRRECFYEQSGLNRLLNYEAQLTEKKKSQGGQASENRNKLFCERFHFYSEVNNEQDQQMLMKTMVGGLKRKNILPSLSDNKNKNQIRPDIISAFVGKPKQIALKPRNTPNEDQATEFEDPHRMRTIQQKKQERNRSQSASSLQKSEKV